MRDALLAGIVLCVCTLVSLSAVKLPLELPYIAVPAAIGRLDPVPLLVRVVP